MQTALTETDEKEKHPGGRPTLFNTRTVRRTKEYIDTLPDDEIPTVAGLAVHLKVSKDAIYNWVKANRSEEFNSTLKRLEAHKESKLIKNGLAGKYNAAITKLILASQHGYTDNNQGHTSINVNVSRDKVKIQHKNESITVEPAD